MAQSKGPTQITMLWLAIVIAQLLLVLPRQADALSTICDVPSGSYPTIQSAIDDTGCEVVNLIASQYSERVLIGRALTIQGQGAANTIVDGAGAGTVFTIQVNGEVLLQNLTVANGLNDNGAGVYNDGSRLTLRNCHVSSNKAPGNGAGVYNRVGQLTITACTFNENLAGSDEGGFGGAIYNEGGTIDIRESVLTDNEAGIYEALSSAENRLLIHESGGAIYNLGGTLSISNSTLRNNTSVSGAAVFNAVGTLTVSNSILDGNEAKDGDGGGVYNSGGSVHISASTFTDNGANYGAGGAISNDGGAVTITNSTLDDNWADLGGALYNSTRNDQVGTMVIIRSIVINNEAFDSGGALLSGSGKVRIILSRFEDNLGGYAGGSIHNVFGSVVVRNSIFWRNRTFYNAQNEGGGAISNYFGTVGILDSTLSDNYPEAIYNQGGRVGLAASTVSFRNSLNADYGIYNAQETGKIGIVNTIIAGNTGGSGCAGFPITSLGHNIATDNTCNLSAAGDQPNTDPLLGPLQDNGGLTWTHALRPGSPAIDAGANTACPSRDQRGQPRPTDGNGDGIAVCDIGAFEAQP